MSDLSKAKKRCQDCVALIAEDDKWVCDECGRNVEEIERCPEGLPLEEEE